MASPNPEIAEALGYFRAKKCAYASPMAVAYALERGPRGSNICVVDVRNPVAPIPTTIKGAVWIPESEIADHLNELPRDKTIVLVCWDTWCSLATSAAIILLEHGFIAKELSGGIKAWQTLHFPEVSLNAGPPAAMQR